MTFPDNKFSAIGQYSDAYFEAYGKAAASVDRTRLDEAAKLLESAYGAGATLYVCGNGGSASIANHLACDHGKLLSTDTDLLPRIQSLAANVEVITAIANDISYADVFVHQLKLSGRPGDVVMTVSSSGDSENVVRADGSCRLQAAGMSTARTRHRPGPLDCPPRVIGSSPRMQR